MCPDRAEPLRVLVVDDHPIWRDGVARDLEAAGLVVCGTAGEGARAVQVAAATRPDVVLLDLQLPDMSGVQVAAGLAKLDPPPRVLVLSASGERQDVLDAMTAGATGYLLKSASMAELLDAVRRVATGDAVFTPGLAGLVLGEYRRLATAPADDAPRLTDRETEILRLVAKGLTYPQIAERLVLSVRTVQNHVQSTLTKLQLHNKAQLVRYAMEQGLVHHPQVTGLRVSVMRPRCRQVIALLLDAVDVQHEICEIWRLPWTCRPSTGLSAKATCRERRSVSELAATFGTTGTTSGRLPTGTSSEEADVKSASTTLPETPPNDVTGGLDWSRDDHAVSVVDARGRELLRHTVEHSAAGLRELIAVLTEPT